MKKICLTFDVEEFDLPTEYGILIPEDEMFFISLKGLKRVLDLVNSFSVRCTFFVTTAFALKNKKLVKEMSKKHEVAYHGYSHSDDYRKDWSKLEKGKKELEKVLGKAVVGFRAPRLFSPPRKVLKNGGFVYDSSYVPSYMPGRYNNFFGKKGLFRDELFIVPVTVLPLFRLPFIWFVFRNLGLCYGKLCTLFSKKDVNLYFHPWEFVSLDKYKLPLIVKRNTGFKVLNLLESYIKWCKKKGYEFMSLEDYVRSCKF